MRKVTGDVADIHGLAYLLLSKSICCYCYMRIMHRRQICWQSASRRSLAWRCAATKTSCSTPSSLAPSRYPETNWGKRWIPDILYIPFYIFIFGRIINILRCTNFQIIQNPQVISVTRWSKVKWSGDGKRMASAVILIVGVFVGNRLNWRSSWPASTSATTKTSSPRWVFVACSLLPVACSLLPVACCLLPVAWSVQCALYVTWLIIDM